MSKAQLIPPALLLFISPLIFGFGCSKEPGYLKFRYVERDYVNTPNDTKLPVELWNELAKVAAIKVAKPEATAEGGEAKSGEHGGGAAKEEGAAKGEGEAKKALEHKSQKSVAAGSGIAHADEEVATELFPLQAFLYEKNNGMLGGRNFQLQFGKGGGELDLQKLVADKFGSFYFVLRLPEEFKELPSKVFFLSNTKERTVEGEKLGAGCSKFMDVTSFFNKTLSRDGILLNTTDARHLAAVGGTFFVAVPGGGKVKLAQLTVTDGRFRSLFCRH